MTKKAFVFPGQGAQAIGMGISLAERFPESKELFDRASQLLGWDLFEACKTGPEDRLRQTDIAQPALYVTGYAAYTVLKAQGLMPDVVAGHSIGEYAALAAANVFGFGEGLALVRERGRLMQDAAQKRPGAMAALLGLSPEQAKAVCAEASATGVCVAVNFNSPEQVVIAGDKAGVEKASALATAAGAKRVIALNVSGAFHSPLMEEAAESMKDLIGKVRFERPSIPVAMNVDGQMHEDPREIQSQLSLQLDHAVLWVDCVNSLKAFGSTLFVECGSGRVLSGLIRRIDKQLTVASTETVEALQEAANLLVAVRKESS